MRINGAGREHLMVVVPMAIVIGLVVIFSGGPAPLLDSLDRRLADVFASVGNWVRSVF